MQVGFRTWYQCSDQRYIEKCKCAPLLFPLDTLLLSNFLAAYVMPRPSLSVSKADG